MLYNAYCLHVTDGACISCCCTYHAACYTTLKAFITCCVERDLSEFGHTWSSSLAQAPHQNNGIHFQMYRLPAFQTHECQCLPMVQPQTLHKVVRTLYPILPYLLRSQCFEQRTTVHQRSKSRLCRRHKREMLQ